MIYMEDNKSEQLSLCTLKVYSCCHKQEVKNGQEKHFKLRINPKDLDSVELWSNQLGNVCTYCFPHVQSKTSSSDKTQPQSKAVETEKNR